MVFPRFSAPFWPKNTTSRDPYPPSSRDPPSGRDPPPSAPLWEGARVRGPGLRGGPGSWLSRTVGGLAVGIPRARVPPTSRDPLPLLTNDQNLRGPRIRGRTPICSFLRFSTKICGFLPVGASALQMRGSEIRLPVPGPPENFYEGQKHRYE